MKRFVEFALRQPLFIWLALALFVGGGVIAFQNLAVEAFPDVSDTQVNIIALYPGRAAEEVEKQVTIPVEIALSGLPNTVRLFTHTQYGLMFAMVTFDDKPTDQLARQQILERLRGIARSCASSHICARRNGSSTRPSYRSRSHAAAWSDPAASRCSSRPSAAACSIDAEQPSSTPASSGRSAS